MQDIGSPLVPIQNLEELSNYLSRPFAPFGGLFLDFLLAQQQITAEQYDQLSKHPKEEVLAQLIIQKVFDSETCDRWFAYFNGMPSITLGQFELQLDTATLIPGQFARKYNLIPVCICKEVLIVATSSPPSVDVRAYLEFYAGRSVEVVYADKVDIDMAYAQFFGSQDEAEILQDISTNIFEKAQADTQDLERLSQAKPTVRLVQNIIDDAIVNRASDIHIRPKEHTVDLFFRIDGQLIKMRTLEKNAHLPIVSRIKIISGMDISERRLPQDGRSKVFTSGREVDLRISVMPTIRGESVVIRILDIAESLKTLDEIGFTGEDKDRFQRLLDRNHGLILVTGPTGSGKSTTLYAALQEIRERNINIITVEDPVEYHIDDVTQIQAQPLIGYTFVKALKHILRHDPDAVMIGEIRDEETAEIAMQSALTGHLVLSTLHTNSAATTITRLLDIGMPPYLLASTLIGVLAQRLLRRNCEHCLAEENVPSYMFEVLGVESDHSFFKGAGCDYCHGTGYKGRLAAYELLTVTSSMRKLMNEENSAEDLELQAEKDGMVRLTEHAVNLAKEGKTSLEEVYRVNIG